MKQVAHSLLLSLLLTSPVVQAFCIRPRPSLQPMTTTKTVSRSSSSDKDLTKSQEMIMEDVSRMGADRIRALGVEERTRRAMLAESVEDRIFALVDEIEQLVASSKMEGAVDLAKQVRSLQMQYQELVSGQPSCLLQSFESLGNDNETP